MLRSILYVGHGMAKSDRLSISLLKHKGSSICLQTSKILSLSSKHFSSDMTQDWPKAIKDFLIKENINKPTAIQEKTLPIAMQNKDLVGVARTGSGKTLAFAIPAVMKILKEREKLQDDEIMDRRKKRSPTCLIIAPTRELGTQIYDVFAKFRNMGINSICLVGGSSRSQQLKELYTGNQDIYIATPGRLIDLVKDEIADLSQIKYLVLDEADRMLDMGFEPQIRSIIKDTPSSRQTLMWSATWPVEIQDLAQEFMNEYEYIAVDSETLKANPNIKQVVLLCRPMDKFSTMLKYIQDFNEENHRSRILIFANQKRTVDTLLIQLMKNKLRAVGMHGDRSQRDRFESLKLFKNKVCNILIATDVAARGLDIDDITHVINYDFPTNIEDYIHRIGRTARHEKTGTSLSFLSDNDAGIAKKLIQVLEETKQEVPKGLWELTQKRYVPKDNKFRNRGRMNSFYSRL